MKLIAPALVALTATGALANPCAFEEKGRIAITGYETGQTKIPAEQRERLSRFAETARHRFAICIFAQVDKQGSDAANERVAKGRADAVRRFLTNAGVRGDAIKIEMQEEALTFWGLLPDDQSHDRRVVVTHD